MSLVILFGEVFGTRNIESIFLQFRSSRCFIGTLQDIFPTKFLRHMFLFILSSTSTSISRITTDAGMTKEELDCTNRRV